MISFRLIIICAKIYIMCFNNTKNQTYSQLFQYVDIFHHFVVTVRSFLTANSRPSGEVVPNRLALSIRVPRSFDLCDVISIQESGRN